MVTATSRPLGRGDALSLAVLALVALVSVTWFRGKIISYEDLNFLPLGQNNFLHYFYSWDSFAYPLGYASSRLVQGALPYYAFVYLLGRVGLSLLGIETVLFYILFSGSGFSMYYFFVKIQGGQSTHVAPLSAALVYMMNTFSLVFIWNYFSTLVYVYSFLPLVLGLFLDRVDNHRVSVKQAFLVSFVWTATSSAAFGNPTFAIYTWVPLIALMFIHRLERRRSNTTSKGPMFTLKIGVTWVLLNSFWIIPLIFSDIHSEINRANLSVVSKSDLTTVVNQNSVPLLDAVRLTGFFLLNARVAGDPLYPWAGILGFPLLFSISLLYPLLFSIGFLAYGKQRSAWYCGLILAIGVMTNTGQYTPLGATFSSLLFATGLVSLFYVTFPRFGMYLALAISLGLGLFQDKIGTRRGFGSKVLPVLVILLVVPVLNFPFFDGSVVRSGGIMLPSARIEVPQYYHEMSGWMGSQPQDGFVLSLPMSTNGYYYLKWNQGYYGTNPDSWVLDRSVLWSTDSEVGSLLSSNLRFGIMPDFAKVLAAINVRYVVVHNDTDWTLGALTKTIVPSSRDMLDGMLIHEPHLDRTAAFGNLTIFENTMWKPDFVQLFDSITPEQTVNVNVSRIPLMPGWDALPVDQFNAYFAKSWTPVVRTDGTLNLTTISFPNRTASPYVFPSYADGSVDAFNTTLLYVRVGPSPLFIQGIEAPGLATYVTDAWWDSGWMGMSTKPVSLPLVIPEYQHAIIEIAGNVNNSRLNLVKPASARFENASGKLVEGSKKGLIAVVSGDATVLSFKIVSPVEFETTIASRSPFQLALLQSYSRAWGLTSNVSQARFQHESTPAYFNLWSTVEPGSYHFEIRYGGQDLIYTGSVVTIGSLVFMSAMILVEKRKRIIRFLAKFRRVTGDIPESSSVLNSVTTNPH